MSTRGTVMRAVDPELFRAELRIAPLVRTRIIELRSSAHRGIVDQQAIDRFGMNWAMLTVLLEGQMIGHQDGHALRYQSGAVWLWPMWLPSHNVTSRPSRSIALQIPRDMLDGEIAVAHRLLGGQDLAGSAVSAGLAEILGAMVDGGPEPGGVEAQGLESALVGMVNAVVADALARARREPPAAYASALALIDAELSDPALDIRAVAERIGASVSALQRAFRAHGTTFGRALLSRRLDVVAAALRREEAIPFAEIASSAGFVGWQAARAFKRRFGMTMGEYRSLVRL